jgi:hypothetical protein
VSLDELEPPTPCEVFSAPIPETDSDGAGHIERVRARRPLAAAEDDRRSGVATVAMGFRRLEMESRCP